MPSNIVVANNELLTVNDQLYGSTRLAMASPIVTQYCGNEKNHSDGQLQNQIMKSLNYDLVQRFPESELAQLVNSASTEIQQANVSSSVFEYVRRALIIEITYSNLDKTPKTQARARMIAELLKKYDHMSYFGSFSNCGIDSNPKLEVSPTVNVSSLQEAINAVRAMEKKAQAIGYNPDTMRNLVTVTYTQDIVDALSGVGDGREKSDFDLFKEAFAGVNMKALPVYIGGASRFELAITPLLTHHHAAMPSLYNNYKAINGLSEVDMFALETSTVEVEEKGALQRQLVTLA